MWTSDDVASLRDAVKKLANGERVVSVSRAGSTTTFGQANLGELRELLAEAESSVRRGKRRRRTRIYYFGSGH